MNKFKWMLLGVTSFAVIASSLNAKEIVVKQEQNSVLNIYSNNLALVTDVRKVSLPAGEHQITFEGVSRLIKPESALFQAQDVSVLEQNYEYNLLNDYNLKDAYIGKKVKTALENPKTGQVSYDEALLLNYINGQAILQFDYGVETNFPGRLIFNEIPENLQIKPALGAVFQNSKAGEKDVSLTYLTNGMSWKADYLAEIVSDNTLNLDAWISLSNDAGVDFTNAEVLLVSGSVNQVSANYRNSAQPLMMARAAKAEMAMGSDMMAMDAGMSVSANAVADYYTYKLPKKVTLKNNQTKQVKLFNLEKVKFDKEYVLKSPLYLRAGVKQGNFEKLNPEIVFKFENLKQNNLGLPLPAGILRFYDNEKQQNKLFLGENNLKSVAEGEKFEVLIGNAFDVFAQGKIVQAKMLAKDIYEYDVEVKITNSSNEQKQVVFEQNIYDTWEIVKENMPSEKINAAKLAWKVLLPKKSEKTLTFKLRVNKN